jgi:hypothetical protein
VRAFVGTQAPYRRKLGRPESARARTQARTAGRTPAARRNRSSPPVARPRPRSHRSSARNKSTPFAATARRRQAAEDLLRTSRVAAIRPRKAGSICRRTGRTRHSRSERRRSLGHGDVRLSTKQTLDLIVECSPIARVHTAPSAFERAVPSAERLFVLERLADAVCPSTL